MSVSIVIATFGHIDWITLANQTAQKTYRDQPDADIITVYGNTLAEARNRGAHAATSDRLVFLDADDELAPGYCKLITEPEDVLQPLTVYRFRDGRETAAHYIEPRPSLLDGNHIVVGAPVNREAFLDVGGFDEWNLAEDWALWLKMKKAGCSFGRTTGTYIVNVNPAGRNATGDYSELDRIRQAYS
jgi:hypothetical protein